uniref:Ribonuclease H-like domain-containing protein n=1 Tax=Tanacetum cinerariifolium TaxID=118510 RepID=A0A6L2J1D6_TANCI|nr:ribonuclease H-like domain-containing protein [Tanacetum cinerariifolium]
MESQSETTQTVSTLQLPVLKTREYDVWSMRMEQYLNFTNHALWEVILNSDLVSSVASASAEDNSSNTNETVNIAHSIYVASSKDQASTASYADDVVFSFFSNQSNASQLDNEDLKQIDTDDLREIDLKWKVAILTMRGNRNRDGPTRNAPVDTSTTNALVVQDGIDKTGLGYDGQMNESHLNDIHVNDSEVLNNVFDSRESDGDDNQVNDRFKKSKGYHAVSPPYTRNYMPPRADLSFTGLDNFVFKSKVSETITSVPKIETNTSKTSKDSLEKPKIVRSSAPIIEDWESDSEDENMFNPKEVKKTVKPSLEKIKFVNVRNTTVEKENKTEKPMKFSQSPRVLTKSGQVPVNAAKRSSQIAAASVSAARPVNTVASRPNMNNALPITYSYFKAHSPVRRPFNQKSAAKANNFNEKVNTAMVNNVTTARANAVVSVAEGKKE